MLHLRKILVLSLLLLVTVPMSAQDATCESALSVVNTLLGQAQAALDNGDSDSASNLILAAQAVITPCLGESATEPATTTSTAMTDAPNYFLQMLAHIPDTDLAKTGPLSYANYRALIASRSGAPEYESFEEWQAAADAESDDFGLWMAAFRGLTGGPSRMIQDSFLFGGEWEDVVGFDFFDIDRGIEFGRPPELGIVLAGEFDTDAVSSAFSNRNYTSEAVGDFMLWCNPNGCEDGLTQNIAEVNRANPFGGFLGREEPVMVSADIILNTPDFGLLGQLVETNTDATPSLADNPTYRAAAEAIHREGQLLQAFIISPEWFFGEGGLIQVEDEAEPIPDYQLLVLADTATEDAQIAYVGLIYDIEADAQLAAESIVHRIENVESLARATPLMDIFTERGVESINSQVVAHEATGHYVMLLSMRAPLPSNEPDDGNRLVSSSMVYGTFYRMIQQFDVAWLAPS